MTEPDPNDVTVHDVTARDVRVRFAATGKGPPLVLLHDVLGDRSQWDDVRAPLAQSHRVVVPDLPGFGESEKPEERRFRYEPAAFAEAIVDLVAAAGLGRVHVAGLGLGALVAMSVAARHPSLVNKLVLVSPPLFGARVQTALPLAGVPIVGPFVIKQIVGKSLFRRHFRERVHGARSADKDARVDQLFERFDSPAAREAALHTLGAMQDTRSVEASVGRIGAPTLVVWGRESKVGSPEIGRKLSRLLAKGTLEITPGGHATPEDAPEEFVGLVKRFLEPPAPQRRRRSQPDEAEAPGAGPKRHRGARTS
jgi:pimeloyl-ACP methyl ester carboxylesterase